MNAFETGSAQWLLRGLDVTDIDIAKNQAYYERLEHFVDTIVAPKTFTVEGAEVDYSCATVISSLELGGMMMNIRHRHTQPGKVTYDPNRFYAVAVGWLDSDKEPEFRFVPSRTDQEVTGRVIKTELLLDGSWEPLEDEEVPDASLTLHDQAELLLEQRRGYNAQLAQTTRFVMGSSGRWLHLPGHVVHRLAPLEETLARVRLARERGFGAQVMKQVGVTE